MQIKNLIASLTLSMTLTAIPTMSCYAEAVNKPNLYVLQGGQIKITYSTTGLDGQPHFTYQNQKQTLNFTGNEIRTVDTEIGTLVSVTIVRTVDTGSTSFSLLIPNVNLGSTNEQKISTKGITTINRFSVIPAFNQGQTQTYTVNSLDGKAQFVFF